MRLLFWNVNKRDLTDLICAIVAERDVDAVVLVEALTSSEGKTLSGLHSQVSHDFRWIPSVRNRFCVFSRNPSLNLDEFHSGFRTSVRDLRLGGDRLMLALIHGYDLRNYDAEARQEGARTIMEELRVVESNSGVDRFVLLGDFNMNPFDRPMNLASIYNSVMTRSCAERGQRTKNGQAFPLYYNPMWSLFGDNTDGPAGTIYDTSDQGPYGWSMFDQILLRHSTINYFKEVHILRNAGLASLQTNLGRPDQTNASNHFPILVTLCEMNQ